MKQTREPVRTVKQSIYRDVYGRWWNRQGYEQKNDQIEKLRYLWLVGIFWLKEIKYATKKNEKGIYWATEIL